eukprot:m.167439 g.167439  ORF g.167439 m.167439 type:complete len:191 (+) comp13464_c1_seq1:29-601(+)
MEKLEKEMEKEKEHLERNGSVKDARMKFQELEDRALARHLSKEYWHEKKDWNHETRRIETTDLHLAKEEERLQQQKILEDLQRKKEEEERSLQMFLDESREDLNKSIVQDLEAKKADEELARKLHEEEMARYEEEKVLTGLLLVFLTTYQLRHSHMFNPLHIFCKHTRTCTRTCTHTHFLDNNKRIDWSS